MKARWSRRLIGLLRVRLADPRFEGVTDPRRRARRWPLVTCLRAMVVAMVSGAQSFKDLENLTAEMSVAARRALGFKRRLPDTTARDRIIRLSPRDLMAALYHQVRAAFRRKALEPDKLPWGVLSMDGKATSIGAWDDEYAQKQGSLGMLRTITATLVSTAARICVGAIPIPPKTNEVGHFQSALGELLEAYRGLDLFRVVMYDAGGCSEANARYVRDQHLHYVMVLNDGQPTLFGEAKTVLGRQGVDQAARVEVDSGVRYTLWLTTEMAKFLDWTHLRVVLRVRREKLRSDGTVSSAGERYFLTSLRRDALDGLGWLRLIRSRWGVENNSHNLYDSIYKEDDRPWINADPTGALNIALLRRIAANLFILFRARTLRGESTRLTPWRDLLRRAYNALISATDAVVDGLRARQPPPSPAT